MKVHNADSADGNGVQFPLGTELVLSYKKLSEEGPISFLYNGP